MKARLLIAFFSLLSIVLTGCNTSEEATATERRVVVSIAPYRPFVKKLMGNDIAVEILVPPGASAHSYEPTARQVALAASADIWFRIGEEFEEPTLNAIESQAPNMAIVDLREGADLLGDPNDPDPHLWLSPLRLKGQLTLMAKSLTELFPKSASEIAKNLEETVKKLENLDLRIHKIIDHTPTTTVMVSHPAYLYFCTDYGLEQLSLERHGSEPGAQAVTDLIREARSKRLNRIFVQPQHSSKGAKVIAKTLDAEIIEMDPFSEDYFDNMRRIAWKFAGY